jgi:hypothetical protein
MKLSTRLGIVAFTLGSCALALYMRVEEIGAPKTPVFFELFDTVQTQILALRGQHYQEAYLQASSHYMEVNGLDNFIETTRNDSSVIRQAMRWEFGSVTPGEEETSVEVRFFLPGGESACATYKVVYEDRLWKIDRVVITPTEEPRSVPGIRL